MPRPVITPRPVAALFLLAAIMSVAAGVALAALQFPALSGRVVDEAGLLTPAERQSLTETLRTHEEATGNQVVVVTLKSLQGTDIQDYGYQLGRAWGIGRQGKDDGALLIVAPVERKVRIEVGYGLEGVLTDAASRLIIERIMLPSFRSGEFGPGILAGAGAIVKMLSGEAEPLGKKPAKAEETAVGLMPLLLLGGFVLLMWISYRRQRGQGLQGGRGVPGRRGAGVAPIIFPGGFGGGGGGFGGGGGGFGGGGGSFGGGGASGDW